MNVSTDSSENIYFILSTSNILNDILSHIYKSNEIAANIFYTPYYHFLKKDF
jgi:hypothetical protein